MAKKIGKERTRRVKGLMLTALLLVALISTASGEAVLTITPNDVTPGTEVTVTGTGFNASENVTISTTVTCHKPVVEGRCECYLEHFEVPQETDLNLIVRKVDDNVTLYAKVLLFWLTIGPDTPGTGFLFAYDAGSKTSTVSRNNVPTGTYSVDVIGDAAAGEVNCTMITTAIMQITADGSGNFTKRVSTGGVPICNFTINATGQSSGKKASAALNLFLQGDPSKDGQINAYDCTCIARYWACIGGYNNDTVCCLAAAGLAPPCDKVDLNDARCLARYLIGKESSLPCSGCS
jgi:hypothetical protein